MTRMTHIDTPYGIRPSWRKWFTRAEIRDMKRIRNFYDENGEWCGSNMGTTISPYRLREHTPRTRRKDARWAKRRGYVVDEKGIIRNPQ